MRGASRFGTTSATTLAMVASAAALAASCALVGYDLGGYHPVGEGGGGSSATSDSSSHTTSTSSAGASQASGGSGGGGGAPLCPQGLACFEPPPAGFTGPYVYSVTTKPGVCASPYDVFNLQGGSKVNSPELTCTNCSCGTEPCNSGAVVKTYTDDCVTAAEVTSELSNGTCAPLTSPNAAPYAEALAIPTTGGAVCGPVGGTLLARPPGSFANSVTVCTGTVSGSACADGTGQCLPLAGSPFEATFCIGATAETKCPNAYPNKLNVYDSLTDERVCSDCTCSTPLPFCTSKSTLFTGAACTGTSLTLLGGATCAATSGITFASVSTIDASPCTPSGGKSTGKVVPSNVTTFCCQ